MNSKILIKSFLIFAIFLPFFASAEDTSSRKFKLDNHGYLELQIPLSWSDEVRQPPGGLPPTIALSPLNDKAFQVLITPLYSIREGMEMPNLDKVKASVESAAMQAKAQSEETTIPTIGFRGTASTGY